MRKAVEDPGYDADVNIIGTINVLEAARAIGARVVFASTGGAGYGEYEGLPVPSPETAETRPLSHYGMSKMAGEGYCHLYGRLYGSETAVLRLGNVYGPRQDPHGEAGVVAIFCGRLLDGERPKIFGDGLQTRDYVYVGDVVRAFLAAEAGARRARRSTSGRGVEVSVLDLLEGLGYEGEPEFVPAARRASCSAACSTWRRPSALYGWRAEVALPTAWRPRASRSSRRVRRRTRARPGPSRRCEPGAAAPAAPRAPPPDPPPPSSAGPAGRCRAPRPPPARPSSSSGGRHGPGRVGVGGDEVGRAAGQQQQGGAPRAPGRARRGTSSAVSCTRAPRPMMSRIRSGARWMASARSGWARITP